MLKQKYFLTGIFILSAERQPIKLAWRKIVWLLYLKDNGLKKDRKGMLYEYTKNQSRVKSIRILGNTDLVRYVKY